MKNISQFSLVICVFLLVTCSFSISKIHRSSTTTSTSTILNTNVNNQPDSADKIQKPDQGPLLGGWNEIDINNLDQSQIFNDQTIRNKFPQLKDAKLVSGKSQVVNGWNYQFIYELEEKNQNGSNIKNTTWAIGSYLSNEDNAVPLIQSYQKKIINKITTTRQNTSVSQTSITFNGNDLTAQDIPNARKIQVSPTMQAKKAEKEAQKEQKQGKRKQQQAYVQYRQQESYFDNFMGSLFGRK